METPSASFRRLVRAAGLAVAIAAASGCGYGFTARGGELPGKVRSVYVPMFANTTAEPAAGVYFTEAAREELARAGVSGGEASDAVLQGEVTNVAVVPGIIVSFTGADPSSRTAIGQVASYRVVATAKLRLMRRNEVLKEIVVSDGEDFQPGVAGAQPGGTTFAQSTLETEGNRRVALRRLAATLMRQGYESLAAGF